MSDCSVKAGSPQNLFETALDIENPGALDTYLRTHGMIAANDRPEIRILQGGVSNRTVLVVSASRSPFSPKYTPPSYDVTPIDSAWPGRSGCTG